MSGNLLSIEPKLSYLILTITISYNDEGDDDDSGGEYDDHIPILKIKKLRFREIDKFVQESNGTEFKSKCSDSEVYVLR